MELLHKMQQLFFITVRVALKKVRTNKHKAKGLGQAFFPKGAGTVKLCRQFYMPISKGQVHIIHKIKFPLYIDTPAANTL